MTLFICVPKLMAANASGDPVDHWTGAMDELSGAGIIKNGVNWSISSSAVPTSQRLGQDPRMIKLS